MTVPDRPLDSGGENGYKQGVSLGRRKFGTIFSVLLAACALVRTAQAQDLLALEHTPRTAYQSGEKIFFQATLRGDADWVTLYYRTPGIDAFQARPMMRTEAGPYVFELDTAVLAKPGFEYYIEALRGDQRATFPAHAPEELIRPQASGGEAPPSLPENLPSPEAELAKFSFPLHVNGTLEDSFNQSAGMPLPDVNPNGNGNVQVSFEARDIAGFALKGDGAFALTNMPPAGGPQTDLTNMLITLTSGAHAVRVGDLLINETEYTSFAFNRRGIEYAFDNQKISLHAFDTNTQLLKGFKGIGVPHAANNVLGLAAGIKLFEDVLALKAVYLDGQDDPNQAANLGVSSSYQTRKGNVFSISQETHLFKNVLSLKAEYAHSSYDADLSDGLGPTPDHAYTLGGGITLGGVALNATYRFIGRTFNSVGLQAMTADRKGLDLNLLVAAGPVSFQGQFTTQKDNTDAQIDRPTTRGVTGNATLNLALSQTVSLIGSYRLLVQDTLQEEVEAPLPDSTTHEWSGGFNLALSPSFMVNATLTDSRLVSESDSSMNTSALTLNVGLMLKAGEILTLGPTLGLSRAETAATGETSTILNGFLTAEFFFVPKILSLQCAGSFNRTTAIIMASSRAIDFLGGLNCYLGQLFGLGNCVLGAKGQWTENVTGGQKVRTTRLLAQATLAF
jgi:hypothetical protein